jgi:hypothetical protein
MSLKKIVKNKLDEYGIDIFKEFEYEKEEVMMAENLTVSCKDDELFVSFMLTASPSFAARIILILKEISEVNKFCVGDDFLFDDDGNLIDGEKAKKYHEECLKKETINEFMKQQSQIYYMNKMKTYNC